VESSDTEAAERDGGHDQRIGRSESREGHPNAGGGDTRRDQPGRRAAIRQIAEDGLDDGRCHVRGEDEPTRGSVREAPLRDEEGKEGWKDPLVQVSHEMTEHQDPQQPAVHRPVLGETVGNVNPRGEAAGGFVLRNGASGPRVAGSHANE
jgi:hypothetical protein